MAEQRTIEDLLARVARAQTNLGPRNPYRLLLRECAEAILDIARQYQELRAAQQPIAKITIVDDELEVPFDA